MLSLEVAVLPGNGGARHRHLLRALCGAARRLYSLRRRRVEDVTARRRGRARRTPGLPPVWRPEGGVHARALLDNHGERDRLARLRGCCVATETLDEHLRAGGAYGRGLTSSLGRGTGHGAEALCVGGSQPRSGRWQGGSLGTGALVRGGADRGGRAPGAGARAIQGPQTQTDPGAKLQEAARP